jgi:anti-sigma regulatory factor (Ser/Thr protein kinase)
LTTTALLQPHEEVFSHEALLYANDEDFLDGTLPFVRDGVAAGEPVLVALAAEKNERLRGELGGDADRVLFADMRELGANPARILPAWLDFVSAHGAGGGPMRGIGEPIWAERQGPELVECQRHESLLNLAFAGTPSFRLLCPYDTSALDDAVVDEALRSHPWIHERGAERRSDRYRGLSAAVAPFDDPLPSAPATAQELRFTAHSLGALRRLVADFAAQAGLDAERADDLVTAVNEVATNSVRYAGGHGVLTLWSGTEWLLFEIADRGRVGDPLAGRRRPKPEQPGGRGLWVANQICDLVQVRATSEGTVVRLHMRR